MPELIRNGVAIDDTFAEAFGMRATAIVITADTPEWAHQAAVTTTGFATSVIACGVEAGIDRELEPTETPDARPGVRVLLFAVSTATLELQLQMRVGQCVLTAPGTACYAGLGRRRAHQARCGDPLFRRRLADLQKTRREALLAHSGHGRRVRLRGEDRPDQERGRRRQSSDHGPRSSFRPSRPPKPPWRRSPRWRT